MRSHLGLGDVKADDVPEDKLNAVAETLRTSDFLKISDDGKKVGLKSAFAKPEEVIEQLDGWTIAASPLPCDVKLEDVESFFAQTAKVNSVRLPHHVSDKRLFCGTALVEFSMEEDAQNVLKQNLVYAGAVLELKPKKYFDAEREKQVEEHKISPTDSNGKGSASDGANYPKGLIVAFTLKSMSSADALKQSSSDEPANGEKLAGVVSEEAETMVNDENKENVSGETSSVAGNKETTGDEKSVHSAAEVETDQAPSDGKSTVAGYDWKNVVLREDLKAVFEKFGTIKYVDFRIGQDSGYLRFEEAEAVQKAQAASLISEEGGIAIKNCIAILEPVTGEAEKAYWSQICGRRDRFQGKGNRGRGRKQKKGGKRGHFRERGSPVSRPKKVKKVAA